MPVAEIVIFPASDTFISDRSTLKPALDGVLKLDGAISAYHGLQVEDNRLGYMIVVWETYEHHKRVMEREDYGDLLGAFRPAFAGAPDVQHVEFDADTAHALAAPVTEFSTLKLKPNASENAFLSSFKKLADEHKNATTCHTTVLGESRENKGFWITLIGWDSIEARENREKEDVYTDVIEDLFAMSDIEIRHIVFTKHASRSQSPRL